MRRILIVINSSRLSGAEASMISQMKFLRDSNEFLVLLPLNSCLQEQFEGDGYRVITINMVRFSKNRTFSKLVLHLLQIIKQSARISKIVDDERIDIVWANSIQSLPYIFPIRFFTKARVFWSLRDNISSKWMGYLFSFFATKVICISEFIKSQLPTSRKNHVIYNGIDVDVWNPMETNPDIHMPKSKEPSLVYIGNIGQLIPWKNQLHFISIAHAINRAFPNTHFLIIGEDLFNDYPDYQIELRRKVIELNMVEHITFLGYKKDIKSIINTLDIIVHTALNEPLGRVILEAMALQKTVFSYSSGGISEVIEDGNDGFLSEENDQVCLANKVIWFLHESSDYKEKIQENAKKKVHFKFNAQSLAIQINKILNE